MVDSLPVPSRRGFITGVMALVAAPAIVRASSLMPVKNLFALPIGYLYIDENLLGIVVGDIVEIQGLPYKYMVRFSDWIKNE